jgi:hypothetical protein
VPTVLDRHSALAGKRDRPLPALAPCRFGRGADRLGPGAHVDEHAVEPLARGPDDPALDILDQRPLAENEAATGQCRFVLDLLFKPTALHACRRLSGPRPARSELLERRVGAEQQRPRRLAVQLQPLRGCPPPEPLSRGLAVREHDLDALLARGTEHRLELGGRERRFGRR